MASMITSWWLCRRSGGYSGGYGGGYGGYGSRGGVYFNLSDILWYWDPWYYRRHQNRLQQGHRPGFLEAIFSFVFGDGDPNQGYEERRWKAVRICGSLSEALDTFNRGRPMLHPCCRCPCSPFRMPRDSQPTASRYCWGDRVHLLPCHWAGHQVAVTDLYT